MAMRGRFKEDTADLRQQGGQPALQFFLLQIRGIQPHPAVNVIAHGWGITNPSVISTVPMGMPAPL